MIEDGVDYCDGCGWFRPDCKCAARPVLMENAKGVLVELPCIHLTVYGTAQPQGNKSGFVNKGRVVMVEGRRGPARDNFKSWREAVATAARDWQREHNAPLLDEPVRVEIVFRLPKPKSAPKRKRWASSRPDIDKLARAVLDAITGTLLVNDSRVVQLHCAKPYTDDAPRAEITIYALGVAEMSLS